MDTEKPARIHALHCDGGSLYLTKEESDAYLKLREKYDNAEGRYHQAAEQFHTAFKQRDSLPSFYLVRLQKSRNFWEARMYGASSALGKFKKRAFKVRRNAK